jgi:hypothetical protein
MLSRDDLLQLTGEGHTRARWEKMERDLDWIDSVFRTRFSKQVAKKPVTTKSDGVKQTRLQF